MVFTWEKRAGRFRDGTTGRFVAERTIRRGVDAVASASSARMVAHTEQLRSGASSVLDWERALRREIKVAHMAQILAAHGGPQAMTQADYGWASGQIRAQYKYLANFAADIVSGRQPLNGRLLARAAMYGAAARATFEAARARDAEARDVVMEERNITGSGDPCSECPGLSARGWVPLGTLPPVGSRACLANCRCRIERRRARRAA